MSLKFEKFDAIDILYYFARTLRPTPTTINTFIISAQEEA